MTVSDLAPGSTEWRKRISASKIAAILGESKWQSPLGLWLEMRGDIEPHVFDPAISARGHAIEAACKKWWLDAHPEAAWIGDETMFSLGDWALATPDGVATIGSERVVLEFKSAQNADEWGKEIPVSYLCQVMWQLHLSRTKTAYVVVLFGTPLSFREYVVTYDEAFAVLMEEKARDFYDSLALDTPPDLSGHVADYSAVKRLHPEIDGTETVTTWAIAAEWLRAKDDLRAAETTARVTATRLLDAMGDSKYAVTDGVRYARRQPNKHTISLVEVRGAKEKLWN